MLELATLGMLLKEPLHGYRLKSWLERYMGSTITANYGAIYPLLRRLKDQGCIESSETVSEGGVPRTTYSITDEGRRRWRREMLAQPRESWVNSRSRFMTKYYFFGWLDAEERMMIVEQRIAACRLRVAEIESRDEQLDDFQKQISGLARLHLDNELAWLLEQQKKMRKRAQA